MVPVKSGNYTLLVVVVVVLVEEIDWWVTQIECLCLVYFPHYKLMLPHYPLGVVMSQTADLMEPDRWGSVEICLMTSYVNI
jgi:ABC-type proline/glycine betaine transport system permease subunit